MLDPLAQALLTPRAIEVLQRANRATTFLVHMYECPGPSPRLLCVLGEVHVKPQKDSEIGKEVVAEFWLRGVEGFQRDRLFLGRLLAVVIEIPRLAVRALTFRWLRPSTIEDARALTWGSTVRLEREPRLPLGLHAAALYLVGMHVYLFLAVFVFLVPHIVPTSELHSFLRYPAVLFDVHLFALIPAYVFRRRSWSWWLHPLVAILSVRDRIMADGTEAMLAEAPEPTTALTIMGMAHLSGYGELLTARGFRRLQFY